VSRASDGQADVIALIRCCHRSDRAGNEALLAEHGDLPTVTVALAGLVAELMRATDIDIDAALA
jgi:hypothetical protein